MTVVTKAIGTITGYNAGTGVGTVTVSSLAAGAYHFRVCAYDASNATLIADGALSSTVYATTAPLSGSIGSAVVSGSNLTLAFSGLTDVDNVALNGVKVSYLTNGATPAANCTVATSETVTTVPTASITGYTQGAGSGSVTLAGLGAATYKVRICAIDGTNTALVAGGDTRTVSLPVVKPADGTIGTPVVSGSAPSSYTVSLPINGFTADDTNISGVKVSYTTNGVDPGVGCTSLAGENVVTVATGSIGSYNAPAGSGTVARSGLSAANYKFRVCGVDANDGAVVGDGTVIAATVTTVPASGSVTSAVVSGTSLTLALSGITDSDNIALYGVQVSYLTGATMPAANCTVATTETVTTVPAASITGYNAAAGTGSVTLTGLSPATYRLRVCPIDGTDNALVAAGATRIASLPVVKPADGSVSPSTGGTGPSSYFVTLNLAGFTADDMGISGIKVSYTSNGATPAVACVGGGGETTYSVPVGSITSYNATTGVGSVVRSGLAVGNYIFRVCGVDANDGTVVADGSTATTANTTTPNNGWITAAVVTGGTNLALTFGGMTDSDNVALNGVKVSYRTDGVYPAAGCGGGGSETVTTVPVASITNYIPGGGPGGGSGSVTLAGLGAATYHVRVCAIDGTNPALVAGGATATRIATLPPVPPADGAIISAVVAGSAPSSYSVTFNFTGFTADDHGINRMGRTYKTDGTDPPAGCVSGPGVSGSSSPDYTLIGYNSTTGAGSVVRYGLSAGNYRFRLCGGDANDTSLYGSGVITAVSVTTVPANGSITSASVSGSNLALGFSGMTDPDGGSIQGVKVSYLSNGGTPAANCAVVAGETVVSIPVASISGYSAGSGSGTATLTGLGSATYRLRVCAVDALNAALAASGPTTIATIPAAPPADGSITPGALTGSGSYAIPLSLSGFTADDNGISGVRMRVSNNGSVPAAGCGVAGNVGSKEQGTTGAGVVPSGYNAGTGTGSLSLSGLSAGNYNVRICGVDANDSGVTAAGATVGFTATAVPGSGSVNTAVVSGGSNLALAFSGFTDVDGVAIQGVKVSYRTDGTTPPSNCTTGAGTTVVSVPVGSLTGYVSGSGSGTVTLTGLGSATYQVRVCAVDGTDTNLVAQGATITASLPVVKPGDGAISGATVTGSGPSSYAIALDLAGMTADDMGISGVKVSYTTDGSTPGVGCTTSGTAVVSTTPIASITGYNPSTGVGTVSRSGLAAKTYKFRVCGVDRNDDSVVADGATITVTAPVVTPASGTVSGPIAGPRSAAGTYTVYLKLNGFTADDEGIGGVRVRVNTGTQAPNAGCASGGSFGGGSADFGTTGAGVMPSDYDPVTGSGSLAVPGLTIPSGNSALYSIRVCSVEANSHAVIAGGSTVSVTLLKDTAAPTNGSLDASTTTVTSGGVATIPISGLTDDRGIDHLVIRVNTGLTAPVANCRTAGTFNGGLSDRAVAAAAGVFSASAAPPVGAGLSPGIPYRSATHPIVSSGSMTVSGLAAVVGGVSAAAGRSFAIRVCAVDSEGNTAGGATAWLAIKPAGQVSQIPDEGTFSAVTGRATEAVHALTNLAASATAYAAATLTVQCPNPSAVLTAGDVIDAELGTFSANAPPFTGSTTCRAEPVVTCAGPRCTAVPPATDPCPKSSKKLGLAVTCPVAPAVDTRVASPDYVVASLLDSPGGSNPTSLVVSCPNPSDTIASITADYGDPSVDDDDWSANDRCTSTATPNTAVVAALAALNGGLSCIGQRSCTVPQGLGATPLTPAFVAPASSKDCPARMTTVVKIACGETYLTSPAVALTIAGANTDGTEICVSNEPLTSAGTTLLARGPCGTTWKAFSSTVVQTDGTTDTVASALANGKFPWTLSSGDGVKTVSYKVHDAAFNESPVARKDVRLDTIAPVRQGMLARSDSVTARARTNRVSWSRFSDTGSGIKSYKLVYTTDGNLPPTDCSDTSPASTVKVIGDWALTTSRDLRVPPSASAPFFHDEEYNTLGSRLATQLAAGTVYTYRLCATDRAGRSSTLRVNTATANLATGTATGVTSLTYAPGATSVCVAAANYTLPTVSGSFALEDDDGAITALGKNWTNSVYVTARTSSLTPSGSGGPYEYCFSSSNQAGSCTTSMWKADAPTISAAGNLGGGDGQKRLYVHVRDQYRNVSASPSTTSAIIHEDRTVPKSPTFTTSSTDADEIDLVWSTPTDAGSGLAAADGAAGKPYTIVYSRSPSKATPAVPPASCSTGSAVTLTDLQQAGTTFTHSLNVRSGFTYAFRLCVSDAAGNRTVGVVSSSKAL